MPARPRLSASQTSASCAMRSGLRKASQRASSSSTVLSRSSNRRCTFRCSRQAITASSRCSVGTFKRSHRARSGLSPACSWPMCLGSMSCGVNALPRSWVKAAKPITASPGASRAAMSLTSSWCRPVSTSGWYSARCGTPYSASTSGNTCASASQSRSVRRNAEGVAQVSARESSCHRRSGTSSASSPARTISRISACVSGATLKPSEAKRAMKRAARNTRRGSSTKAGPAWRSTRALISLIPPSGSTSVPSSACAMALMVKSRRPRSCSSDTDGSASTTKPR